MSDDEHHPSKEEIGAAVLAAARYGDLEDLKELIGGFGLEFIHYQDPSNNTPLHFGQWPYRNASTYETTIRRTTNYVIPFPHLVADMVELTSCVQHNLGYLSNLLPPCG